MTFHSMLLLGSVLALRGGAELSSLELLSSTKPRRLLPGKLENSSQMGMQKSKKHKKTIYFHKLVPLHGFYCIFPHCAMPFRKLNVRKLRLKISKT